MTLPPRKQNVSTCATRSLPPRTLASVLGAVVFMAGCAVDTATPSTPVVTVTAPEEAPLVALTPTELNNTYRDLLGLPMDPEAWPPPPPIAEAFKGEENDRLGIFGNAVLTPPPWPWIFPDEAGVDGFSGIASGQESSAFSVETLQKAATHFATYALVSEAFLTCEMDAPPPAEDPNGVYWADVAPVLAAGCGGCHTGGSSGSTNFASVYADNLKDSEFCAGLTVGACAIARIADGSMPPPDSKNTVSGDDLALLELWVASGMPQVPPGTLRWENLSAAEKESCGRASVANFAARAWRRPLDEGERTRLDAMWTTAWSEGSPEEAVVLTVAAILQSPAFLFRIEEGDPARAVDGAVPLTDHEVAARLSYFLWDSLPDGALFAAADDGELRTPSQVEAQARRLLKDPRARQMVVDFHDQWLETDQVLGISPARRVYGPSFGLTPEPPLDTTGDQDWPNVLGPIRRSLEAETHLFVERTVFDGVGTLGELLTDHHGYMSAATEPLYGPGVTLLPGPTVTVEHNYIAASGSNADTLTLYPVELPADERAGLLTLPSLLAVGAYAVHPAPILRGKRVLERLFCQELGAPPPNADASAPPDVETAESTNRERTEAATSPPECVGCHQTLNPPGFAFEHYDAMGRYRTEDNGLTVDSSGSFTTYGGESFSFEDGVDLAHQLAMSEGVHDCYTMRWARVAAGAQLEPGAPGLEAIQSAFRSHDHIKDLLVSIATSDVFRHLPEEVSP